MGYDTLRKIYYADRSGYEAEYLSRFNSKAAVHIDFDIKGNPAFFLPTEELLALDYSISRLDRAVSRIKASLPSAAASQYYLKSLIDEVHLTLDIERVASTRKEIADIHRGKKDTRLSGMINKYATLMSGARIPLETCEDVRALYDEICLPEVVSENEANRPDGRIFRQDQNYVVGKSEISLHEGLYPEHNIIAAMNKALSFLNHGEISTPLRVAAFHYMLGYIHPFYDGNGRMARFISSYALSREMDPLIGVRLSYTIKDNISTYYKLFKETNDAKNKGDLTFFIIGFLNIVEISYKNLYEALRDKADQLTRYTDTLYGLHLNDKLEEVAYLLLQVTLFSPNGIRLEEILSNTRVGEKSVRHFLTSEKTRQMFIRKKDGRANVYSLNLDWLTEQSGNKQ